MYEYAIRVLEDLVEQLEVDIPTIVPPYRKQPVKQLKQLQSAIKILKREGVNNDSTKK